jgi:hypothetical protein
MNTSDAFHAGSNEEKRRIICGFFFSRMIMHGINKASDRNNGGVNGWLVLLRFA